MPARERKINLILVRHGEALTGPGGNGRLTRKGKEQARRLGRWLAENYQIQAVYTSPLIRTLQTAKIINRKLRVRLVVKEGLKGIIGEPKLQEALPKSAGPFEVDSPLLYTNPLGAEYRRLSRRLLKTLSEITRSSQAETILVVSHTDVIATLVRTLFGGHLMAVNTDYTGVSSLRWDGGRWEVVYLNRREHLT